MGVNPSQKSSEPVLARDTTTVYDTEFVKLIGPLSQEDIVELGRRHLSPYLRFYYPEGFDRDTVRNGIGRIVHENPNEIDTVDLYDGNKFIRTFFPGETETIPFP